MENGFPFFKWTICLSVCLSTCSVLQNEQHIYGNDIRTWKNATILVYGLHNILQCPNEYATQVTKETVSEDICISPNHIHYNFDTDFTFVVFVN